jgi:hypothetical protein
MLGECWIGLDGDDICAEIAVGGRVPPVVGADVKDEVSRSDELGKELAKDSLSLHTIRAKQVMVEPLGRAVQPRAQ